MNIALLTQSEFLDTKDVSPYTLQIRLEEAWLVSGFAQVGIEAHRVAWDDPDVDWRTFRAAIFRSTWDYFHRFAEFAPWLAQTSKKTQLINDTKLIQWNMDKHYLQQLEARGVAIVPTVFVDKESAETLAEICRAKSWHEAVFKPVVSGGARLTHRFCTLNMDEVQPLFARALINESMMVQPFLPSVTTTGEVSVIVIGGQISHAIRKIPKSGDFRVQDDHGGVVLGHQPSAAEIQLAKDAVFACDILPLYARVDMVQNESGKWQIMELELIEPELFFRFHTPSAQLFCQQVRTLLC